MTVRRSPLFIVFEGIDGSGKSTQAGLAYRYVQDRGIECVLLCEPSRGPWGKKIRAMLSSENPSPPEEQHRLFLLDRSDDVSHNITPAFASGKSIVMDRYYYSNAAYQGAGGLSPEKIIEDNRSMHFPEPHRVYCIDITPEAALDRIARRNSGGGTECFERLHFLTMVREIYLSMTGTNFLIVDGSLSEDQIHSVIREDLNRLFGTGG